MSRCKRRPPLCQWRLPSASKTCRRIGASGTLSLFYLCDREVNFRRNQLGSAKTRPVRGSDTHERPFRASLQGRMETGARADQLSTLAVVSFRALLSCLRPLPPPEGGFK